MTRFHHPGDFDEAEERGNPLALLMALVGIGFLAMTGIGLALQGLWVVGVPMAVVFGIWFLRTLIRRPPWRFGGASAARPPLPHRGHFR